MTSPGSLKFFQRSWFLPGILSLFLGFLYNSTMSHTVDLEDSGLFLTTATFLGIPQPTGYPLYILLAKAFSLIPMGSVAFRIHWLNAALAILSCLMVYRVIQRITGDRWASFFGSLLLGISDAFWYQAMFADVYMLNVFLFLLSLDTALALREKYQRKMLMRLALLTGLGCSNHLALFVLPSVGLTVLLWKQRLPILRDSGWFCLFFLMGLLPYIHLYTAQFYSDFLFTDPIKNWQDFYDYITREHYDAMNAADAELWSFGVALKFALSFLKNIIETFSLLVIPSFLIGIVGIYFRHRVLLWGILSSIFSSSTLLVLLWRVEFHLQHREVYFIFQLVPYSLCAILFGYALFFIREILPSPSKWTQTIPIIIGILCVGAVFSVTFPQNVKRPFSLAEDYASFLLEFLPRNSVFFVNGAIDMYPVLYLHFVEKIRPDLLSTSQSGLVTPVKVYSSKAPLFERGIKLLSFIQERHKQGKRVFTTGISRDFNPITFGYKEWGPYVEIVDQSSSHDVPVPIPQAVERAKTILDRYDQGQYSQRWQYMQSETIRILSKVLLYEGEWHPAFKHHAESQLIYARILSIDGQQYELADQILLDVLEKTKEYPHHRQLEIHQQFLINRLNWLQSGMYQNQLGDEKSLIQNTVNRIVPIATKNQNCENTLARSLLQISRHYSVEIKDDSFVNTFDCQ